MDYRLMVALLCLGHLDTVWRRGWESMEELPRKRAGHSRYTLTGGRFCTWKADSSSRYGRCVIFPSKGGS